MKINLLGIPRLKELINVSKTLKTPSMTIYVDEPYKSNKDLVRKLQVTMQFTTLNDILEEYAVFYDPDYKKSSLSTKDNASFLNIQNEISKHDSDLNFSSDSFSPWIIRLQFSRKQM